jgi:hypothetical protein
MTVIAPVLFDAFPEDARHDREAPYRPCFNAGAPSDVIRTLSTACEEPRAVLAAAAMVAGGLLPMVGSVVLAVIMHLFFGNDALDVQGWLVPVILSGVAVAAAGGAWAWYLNSRFHPKARAWSKTLGDIWAAHGAYITELWTLGYPSTWDVREFAETLEEIREGLNGLDPEGDELDGARYALQRYIEASNLPALGAKAAAATHIEDPKVRQTAKEYEAMVKQQDLARKALEIEIDLLNDLLSTRTQARADADLIRSVYEL